MLFPAHIGVFQIYCDRKAVAFFLCIHQNSNCVSGARILHECPPPFCVVWISGAGGAFFIMVFGPRFAQRRQIYDFGCLSSKFYIGYGSSFRQMVPK